MLRPHSIRSQFTMPTNLSNTDIPNPDGRPPRHGPTIADLGGLTVIQIAVASDSLCRFAVWNDGLGLTVVIDSKAASLPMALALERIAEVLRSEESALPTSAND